MDATSLDLLGFVKTWIPWGLESNSSRDFWMPDHSCRVCYECDTLFTLFNRRHHCRLCGRIFCAKCTSNWIPRSLQEAVECEKVRVCQFCYEQRKECCDNHAIQVSANLDATTSLSASTSFISIKSSGAGDSNSSVIVTSPPHETTVMESSLDRQNVATATGSTDPTNTRAEDLSTSQFTFSAARSDDDDDEYGVYQLDSQGKHYSQSNGYYGLVHYGDIDKDYGSRKVHPNVEAIDEKSVRSSSLQNSFDSHASEEAQQIVKQQDIIDESEASSSLYAAEDVNLEPVDFESNGVLWLPPEPEDEEDERESLMFDDDDDGDAAGEWGYLRASSSFGSGEYRGKDRSNEEQKKAVKNEVVDGHFRALVSQLMQVGKLDIGEEDDKESWLEIITSLSWKAASLLKPDTSKGGGMDPGGYVKVKCIASGRRSDSAVVKGVVCKKNVAHRRMTAKIDKPRILILEGALEYQRVSNHLSSFDTLLQQEMDHLKMAVTKIDAHNPDVLLVEKSVSRYAQEYLLAKDISLVLNIKKPVLERIARCTGGQLIPSIDHLSSPKLGYCDMFRVEKFLEEHGTAGETGKKLVKTLMYFDGCPKPLGCTVLLRGANEDELKKVKRVVQYSIFAAYHLALETSFLADEGASLPGLPLNSPMTVALPDKPLTIDRSISTIPGFTIPACEKTDGTVSSSEPQRSQSAPTTDFVKAASICAQKMGVPEFPGFFTAKNTLSSSVDHESSDIINMLSQNVQNDSNVMDVNQSGLQLERKNTRDDAASSKEEFPPSPSDNRSILVSLSSRCVWKGTVCERSHLFRIKYYGNFDKPLGRFLRDHLFDQGYRCHSCEMPSEAHVQCYTHREGTLTISVKKLLDTLLPGEKEGKIWMWHRCLKCPRDNKGFPPATRRVVMSDAAWGLSFGKFLELSFSNHAAASRVASCGHSLHRDCLRFYGFGKMVACFRYASIDVHSVYLPPSKLDFNHANQEWIQKEVNEVVDRAELLFSEVLNAIRLLVEKRSNSIKVPEARRHIADLEEMLQKEKEEFEESLQRILKEGVKMGQPVDILEINRLRRQLLFQSYVWDHRLVYTASLDEKTHWNGDVSSLQPEKRLLSNEKLTDLDNPAHPSKSSNGSEPVSSILKYGENAGESVAGSDASEKVDNLSVTLEAAWTGETTGELEDNLLLSSKGSENLEESVSWLGIPFFSFYRSLNKNFLPSAQKLDPLGGYTPVYISSFRESDAQSGGTRLLLPVGVNDTVIPVYDDEPTSIISYALVSHDYISQLSDELEKSRDGTLDSNFSFHSLDSSNLPSPHQSIDEMVLESYKSLGSLDESILSLSLNPGSYNKTLHARVSFWDDGALGKVKYMVTCYYAKRFETLRRICCPSEMDFVRSLSRCKKWGAQGGKSNVFFAKTLDDRFIIKQVSKTELESFLKFAPAYFKYLSESISSGSPTCLAKILGIYQVSSKHLNGGKESKMDVLVMENLLFGRNLTRLYDLKGSSRSRYNPDSTGSNKVLLDQNLIESMPTSPIFVGNKAKRLLERAVWNDTAFLASVDVMDYSLLVGVDEEKHELVLGIIDFMRQYTWDKHLETWVKSSGILGGPKNASPTVISPKQYKKRFRKAMTTYFLMIPDQWSPPSIVPSMSQTDLSEENLQGGKSAA